MKKSLLSIIILISLFAGSIKGQQVPDLKTSEKLRHDMGADKNDSWSTLSFLYGPQLWIKQHYIDSLTESPTNKAVIGYYGTGTLARLNKTKTVELAATGITLQNAGKYLYHVVLNDSVELVHWTRPTVFRSNKFISYAYLGKFNCLGKIIKLELYEINNYKNKAVITINGGYQPVPKIDWIAFNAQSNYIFNPGNMDDIPVKVTHGDSFQKMARYFLPKDWKKKPISIPWSDHINGLIIEMQNTLQNDIYYVWIRRFVNGKTDEIRISNNWQQTEFSPNPSMVISSAYFNRPGKYEVIVKAHIPKEFKIKNTTLPERIPFIILPGPVTLPIKTVAFIVLIILTTAGFCFMMYREQQKRKLAKAAQNKQIATLQLQAVRSQLNPHFIFNALAGIQNLMNKNEVESANKYLSRFARLTRNILDDGNKELTSIEQETDLLRDYLQMEQMRFGFKFNIAVDEKEIDQQIEIPAMLLQPFAENAVKHGVSALKEQGQITIIITKQNADLILTVQDNGAGFKENSAAGMGIKLCQDRIALLNSIYKNTTILLHKTSGSMGTTITIELKNWL